MRDYIKLTGILFIICAIAAASLGYTNAVTYDRIQEQMVIAGNEAKKAVLPGAETFEELEDSTFSKIKSNEKYNYISDIYIAKAGGNIIGYAVKATPKGYGGSMDVIVGVAADGSILGVRVGNNSETPGLGKKAETPKFQEQFNGKTWDNGINVIKSGTPKDNEIAAISGATVTSGAVTAGVNQALEVAKELSGK
ncbi:MAG TPA: RnfABCDGE type electron transport complex subunit G [Bacillota bacterium]|nr:RnfABCDGE type electron transport complex subunit G [Bacillota bacterium]HPL53864.1 RnfABCDGE type electron transport complex subunit G [Bacillota bacterium]